ncbi:MAG: DnaA/Hda family protein [Pseudomonadota bacterium]
MTRDPDLQQLTLNLPFATSYHPADFAESACNADALSSVRNYREWPSYGLCVVGDKGSGKTHLASIYHFESPTALSLAPEDVKKNRIFEIAANHIIIDDADLVKDEKAFFHLINLVKERKGRLFITATTPPSSWKIRLPDLKSRLCSLPVVKLHAPDKTLLHDILLKLFSDRQMSVDPDLSDYIISHIQEDIKILEDLVGWLHEEVSISRKPLSKAIFRNVLFAHTDIMNDAAKERFLGIIPKAQNNF